MEQGEILASSHAESELTSACFQLHNTFHFSLISALNAEDGAPSAFDSEIGRGRKGSRKDHTAFSPLGVHVYRYVSLDLKWKNNFINNRCLKSEVCEPFSVVGVSPTPQ